MQGSYFTSSKDGFPGISADWPPSDRFHGDRRPSVPRDRRCGGSSTLVWSATERWDDGTGWLLIERSKTDQTGEGEVVFITRRAMTALDELRQIREDYGDASPSVFVMTAKTINCRVKAAAQAAGLGEGFSGHSAWWGWPGGWTGPAPGLGDHAAGPMAQHRRGGEVHPGRVRPVAEMRGMSQRSFGAVAVLTVRGCRAQHGRALQQPSGLGRHYSAPGGWRTLRSAQCGAPRGPGASPPVRSAENPSRDRPSVPGPRCRHTSPLTSITTTVLGIWSNDTKGGPVLPTQSSTGDRRPAFSCWN